MKYIARNKGIVLLPAMVVMIFLTATVATFLIIVQQEYKKADLLASKAAAKWFVRSGTYIAEELMRNAAAVSGGIDGVYTLDSSAFTTAQFALNPSDVTNLPAIGNGSSDLPGYLTVVTAGAQQMYQADFSPPSALWGTNPLSLYIYLAGSVADKNIFLYVTPDVAYRREYLNYVLSSIYQKSSYLYYQATHPDYVFYMPTTLDCGQNSKVHIDGFWNIVASLGGSTIVTDRLEVNGYVRVVGTYDAGIDSANVPFGLWTGNSRVQNIRLPVSSSDVRIRYNGGNDISGTLPVNLFRFAAPDSYTYWNYTFITDLPSDYAADLVYWNGWRTGNNLDNILVDITSGAQGAAIPGPSMAQTVINNCNQQFAVASIGFNSDSYQQQVRCKNAAQLVADSINNTYGDPAIAVGRALVNTLFEDKIESAVEIDLSKLSAAANLNTGNNKIYIGPPNGGEVDIENFAVILKNGANLSTTKVNDLSIVAGGAVFTAGNINTNANKLNLTIAGRDTHFVVSTEANLTRYYLDQGVAQRADYDHLLGYYLQILDDVYASSLHTGGYNVPTSPFYNREHATGPSFTCTICGRNDASTYINGQYWDYYADGTVREVSPNAFYGKKVPYASNTTINALIINGWGAPEYKHENWNNGARVNINGSINVIGGLKDGTHYRYSPSASWWSNNPQYNSWSLRTQRAGGWKRPYIYPYNGGVYTALPDVTLTYDGTMSTTLPIPAGPGNVERMTCREGLL